MGLRLILWNQVPHFSAWMKIGVLGLLEWELSWCMIYRPSPHTHTCSIETTYLLFVRVSTALFQGLYLSFIMLYEDCRMLFSLSILHVISLSAILIIVLFFYICISLKFLSHFVQPVKLRKNGFLHVSPWSWQSPRHGLWMVHSPFIYQWKYCQSLFLKACLVILSPEALCTQWETSLSPTAQQVSLGKTFL